MRIGFGTKKNAIGDSRINGFDIHGSSDDSELNHVDRLAPTVNPQWKPDNGDSDDNKETVNPDDN